MASVNPSGPPCSLSWPPWHPWTSPGIPGIPGLALLARPGLPGLARPGLPVPALLGIPVPARHAHRPARTLTARALTELTVLTVGRCTGGTSGGVAVLSLGESGQPVLTVLASLSQSWPQSINQSWPQSINQSWPHSIHPI